MYDFDYNRMKAQYREPFARVYADTASLLLARPPQWARIRDTAVQAHLTSNYPRGHPPRLLRDQREGPGDSSAHERLSVGSWGRYSVPVVSLIRTRKPFVTL